MLQNLSIMGLLLFVGHGEFVKHVGKRLLLLLLLCLDPLLAHSQLILDGLTVHKKVNKN